MEFWSNFLSEFLAALIGVITGIPVALWLDRRLQEKRQRSRAASVLSALKDEIGHNAKLLKQMQDDRSFLPLLYNLDLSAWKATTARMLDSVDNVELTKQIARIYYEFEQLSKKVGIRFTMFYSTFRAVQSYNEDSQRLRDQIRSGASELVERSNRLVVEIDNELSRLPSNRLEKNGGETGE